MLSNNNTDLEMHGPQPPAAFASDGAATGGMFFK